MTEALVIEALSKRYRLDRQVGAVPVPSVLGFTVKEARVPGFEGDFDEEDEDDALDELEEDEEILGVEGEIWALRDITLSVPAGESLGLVGRNGAGKSTLLKVLARVTPPTEGRVRMRGRPSPLLSVTTALLQPELTVAQNVRLLGDFFGVPRSVVARRLDAVLRFAELEGRADMKLKRASTGMARRLGISIALNLEPTILLADGPLATGDADFREKCLDHVEALCEQGATLVMASEDEGLLRRLCQYTAWLEDGQLVRFGRTPDVLAAYAAARDKPELATREAARHGRDNEFARLLGSRITRDGGEPVDTLGPDDAATIEIEIEALRPIEVDFTILLFADHQAPRPIRGPLDWRLKQPGRAVARFELLPGALPAGRYVARTAVWVSADGRRLKLIQLNAFTFDVEHESDEVQAVLGEPVHGVAGWRLDAF